MPSKRAPNGPPTVDVRAGGTLADRGTFQAFDAGYHGGVRVGALPATAARRSEILAVPGFNSISQAGLRSIAPVIC